MVQKMTSRERIQKAIRHQETDRVPIDIGGTKVTGIHVDEYVSLIRYLELDLLPPKVYEQWQMLARVDEMIMKWLHSDVIQLENPSETFGLTNENWKIWRTNQNNDVLMPGNFNPVRDDRGYQYLINSDNKPHAVMAASSLYFDKVGSTDFTLGDITFTDPEVWRNSIPKYSDHELMLLQKRARFLWNNTDYSIHGGFFRGSLGTGGIFAGHSLSDWLCILVTEKAYADEILQATTERVLENLALYLQAVGPYIDTILVSATDFGIQNGPMFDPEIFKVLHKPKYRTINDFVHAHCEAKTFFHSCGSVRQLIQSFIEAGVDILNPVQTNAAEMNATDLKDQYGDQIAFWGGGIETQTVLPFGSPVDVQTQVLERLKVFSKGGGFVFSPIHNTQFGVPIENLETMIETVYNYRQAMKSI